MNDDPDRWVKALRAGEPKAVDAANRLIEAMSKAELISPTSLRILQLLADGYTRDEIHTHTGLSHKKIMVHLQRLRWYFGASNITHTVFLGYREGLIR